MGRMRVEPGECVGSGGIPLPRTTRFEKDDSTTGICGGCMERMTLDADGFVSPHSSEGLPQNPFPSLRLAAEPPDIRPDLHKLITCHDDVLSKIEAGAVLPEYVRLQLKEERALLMDILSSLGG